MKKYIRAVYFTLIMSLILSLSIHTATVKSADRITVMGYATKDYPTDYASIQSINTNKGKFDMVSSFSYLISKDGLKGNDHSEIIKASLNNRAKPLMVIHNYSHGFSSKLAEDVLSSPESRKQLIDAIMDKMKLGFEGVNIDIEGIPYSLRDEYNTFLEELKDRFDGEYILTAAIPAKTFDNRDGWSGGFDYSKIGKIVDYAMIMAYDEHWPGGLPGPIASIGWVEGVVEYAVDNMDPDKILLGLAAYGYDWSEVGTSVINQKDADRLTNLPGAKVKFDSRAKEVNVEYYKDGYKHVVWLEDEHSIGHKIDLVKKYGLAGVGIWKLGNEDSKFWDVLMGDEKYNYIAFNDVIGHWAEDEIISLKSKDIINGYEDGGFHPNYTVTRAEFSKMLSTALNLNNQDTSFRDTSSHWARGYIGALQSRGIITGYPDRSFRPDSKITREEMATIVAKSLNLKPKNSHIFKDTGKSWAEGYINAAYEAGLIKGYSDGRFKPYSYATRAETAAMINNLLKIIEGN
ncbi:MAG: S-layer homology domain-containing protein [Thermoanaerobacteraceae bacterium]|nr:S-layer homology domain-containing protein [Thermoanaerobacteraceae bacterium]